MANSERVHKFLTQELTIRASAVIATHVVDEMRAVHDSFPIATVALGRTMIGSLLLASQLKENQALSLYFQGDGGLGRVFAEATYEGKTRGYVTHPKFMLLNEDAFSIGAGVGRGLLTVTHHLPTGEIPHRGSVQIRTGEVGDDIAYYLHQSHQIPSIVSLGVLLDENGKVTAAGGVLIELMPGVTEETIAKLETRVRTVPPISKRIFDGASAEDIVNDYLSDFGLIKMEHDYEVKYECRCNIDRVKSSVALLGAKELDEIISDGKPLEITCEFCGRKYSLSPKDLAEVKTKIQSTSLN